MLLVDFLRNDTTVMYLLHVLADMCYSLTLVVPTRGLY